MEMIHYTMNASKNGDYIEITVKGEITRERAMKLNSKAHALGKKLGIHKYLVDLTQCRNVDTVSNNYSFAYEDMAKAENLDRNAVVASLVGVDDHSHDFVETVARNAGLDVTLFRDRQQAIEHLKK